MYHIWFMVVPYCNNHCIKALLALRHDLHVRTCSAGH